MKFIARNRRIVLLFAALSVSAANAPSLIDNEQLRYTINWPSGLSLGEATLSAASAKSSGESDGSMRLAFDLDASVPGFTVTDRYRSQTTKDVCSTEFDKTATHGKKKTDEKTTFDQHADTATRLTASGGKTEMKTSQCARDALAFLYYARHELSQGRVPAPQTIYFGSAYEVRLVFAGTQSIRLGDRTADADRLNATVKGPSSEISFEVFFLKDRGRTPALVRVPLELGTFTMELVK